MKLILIQPPIQDFYDTDIRLQPLGLAYLKAAVKKHCPAVDVVVKDFHQGYGRRTITLPSELKYLEEYYPYHDLSPFSTFHRYYQFGAEFKQISRELAEQKPDLVGISSLFSPYSREVLACARAIKKDLDVPIIVGGSHVSAAPLSVLQDPNVDFVIRGQGERPLVELLKAHEQGVDWRKVPNLGFKEKGKMILNPLEGSYRFEDLAWPDFSDLDKDQYLFKRKPLCFMAGSRGCPHHCSFCSVQTTFGHSFQQRSISDILAEIKMRYAEGYRVFDFEDDNISFQEESFKKLLEGLFEHFSKEDVHFTAMNGISYLSLDQDILNLMKRVGFRDLNISLVSSNRESMEKMNRAHALEKYEEVVNQAYFVGLNITSYQILGLPHETLDQMVSTLKLLAQQPVLIGASIFYLTPGCPLAYKLPGLSETDIFKSRLTAMAIETDHFKREDIYTLFIMSRIINFLKGIKFNGQKLGLDQALVIFKACDKRSSLGAEILERLFREQKLYAATRQGFKPLPRFKAALFFKAWQKIGFITTRQGARIEN